VSRPFRLLILQRSKGLYAKGIKIIFPVNAMMTKKEEIINEEKLPLSRLWKLLS